MQRLVKSDIYLLTCYQPAFTVTRKKEKKKKTRQEQEIKISRITARGKKEKKYHRKKKEKVNSFAPVAKNQEICSQLVKRINKTHRKTLQCYNYKSAQNEWSQLQN